MNITNKILLASAGFIFLLSSAFVVSTYQEEPTEYFVFADDWVHGIPTGFMGEKDGKSLKVETVKDNPYKGNSCVKFKIDNSEAWRGIHIQFTGAWNVTLTEKDKLPDLTGYEKLEFYARAECKNGEPYILPEVGVGGGGGFEDKRSETYLEIGPEWKRYTVNIKGMDLKRVNTMMMMVLAEGTFYLDEIKFIKSVKKKKK